jgi:hypothetical protein
MAKRTRTAPSRQRTSKASGPTRAAQNRSASTSRRRFMRPYGRLPFGRGAKSTTSCWRGLRWRSGNGDGGGDGQMEEECRSVARLAVTPNPPQEWRVIHRVELPLE